MFSTFAAPDAKHTHSQIMLDSTFNYNQAASLKTKIVFPSTHGEDIVAAGRHHLLGRHQRSPGVDTELFVLIPLDDAVGDVAIGSLVTVISKDPVDRFAAFVAVSLRQADAVGDLWEGGRVIVLVIDVNDDPHGGLAGGHRAVDNRHLNKQACRSCALMSGIFHCKLRCNILNVGFRCVVVSVMCRVTCS